MKFEKNFRRIIAVLFAGICAQSLIAAPAATVTNKWIAVNGNWGDGENWSLGHCPTDSEMAYFDFSGHSVEITVDEEYKVGTIYVIDAAKSAPLTFKGTGRIIHNGYSPSPYIYRNHPFTLDGVTIDIGNFESLWYSPMTIKNGGAYKTQKRVYLWTSSANLTIDGGSLIGGELGYGANVSVSVKDGELNCSKFTMRDVTNADGSKKVYNLNLDIKEGGAVNCANDMELYGASSLKLNGGALTVGGQIELDETVSLDLSSGAITNGTQLTNRRFVTENKGVPITVTASGDAVFLEGLADGDTLEFKAPFHIPNGKFCVTNRITLVSDYPFETERIYYATGSSASTAPITVRLSELVLGEYSIFDTATGDARAINMEGPTTWRPTVESMNPKTSRTVYPHLDGELVVDTRDWNDSSLSRHVAMRNIASAKGNGAIVVRGGGSFYMTHLYNHYPFRYVRVEEGSMLELGPFENSEYSSLNAMKIVLEAGAVLKVPGGTNCVAAMEWEVDPSARIIVNIPEGIPAGGIAVLRDYSGKLSISPDQVEFTGDGATGWNASCIDGNLAAVKAVEAVDGTYAYEWTGGADTDKWTDALNWYCQEVAPKEKTTVCAFGAADKINNIDFDTSGGYVGQIVLRNSATVPFTVSSSGERTFFINTANDSSKSCVYSESAVPHYMNLKFRKTGAGSVFSFTSTRGPVIIGSPVSYPASGCILSACGDIRVATSQKWPQVFIYSMRGVQSPHSHLMVMPGASMLVTNQVTKFTKGNTSFYVHKDGVLDFEPGDTGFYQWTVVSGKHIVNGEMKVSVPFMGGANQVYGGSGNLAISSIVPASAASTLTIQDTLTLELASDWTTVKDDADFPFALEVSSFSAPTLKLSDNWTYGAASGSASTTDPASRAVCIGRCATLTVDAGGYTAKFADPVAGEGTLAIRNGNLKLESDISPEVSIELADTGKLVVDRDMSIGKLKASGGKLLYSGGSLSCASIENLDGLEFEFAAGMPERWTTVMVLAGELEDLPAIHGLEFRIVEASGSVVLQCRKDAGFRFIVR